MIAAAIAIILLVLRLCFHLYKNAYKRPENYPPGPPTLPIYGGLWAVLANDFDNLANAFCKLGVKYKSKVLGLYFGTIPAVILNDPYLIKEMLNREEFDGRVDIFTARARSYWKRLGIFFTDSYFWHLQRRFSLRYMRDYGFGRRDETLESVVAQEVKEMLDMGLNGPKYSAEKEIVMGDLVYLPHYFAVPFINGMLHVFSRMTLSRPEYRALWDLARGSLMFQRSSNDFGGVIAITPWLKNIAPNWTGYNDLRRGNQYLLDFFEKLTGEIIATYDESHDRHFLDIYIKKMKEEQRQAGRTTFSVEQLVLVCTDYTFPAASAAEAVLTMLVERLLIQPEIQEKLHEEIDRVVGRDRLPNLDDRRNMPYTEACIRETMRFDTLVPFGVPHRADKATKIGGYDIPEDTAVAANYVTLHMDKEIWGDPENFRPERFIIDGQLNLAKDKSLPFGAGRRLCAGETYARQTMFQVFSAFMQTFKVSTADGRPLQKPSKRIQGIVTTIPNYWVRVTPRCS